MVRVSARGAAIKGKKRFSTEEAALIRRLLQVPDRSKSIRAKLRANGFFISDWSISEQGFYLADFERIVENGKITIQDGSPEEEAAEGPQDEQSPRRDEHYILDLCDQLLDRKAERQYIGFRYLLADDKTRLPVDAYYPDLKLAIEYHERQQSSPTPETSDALESKSSLRSAQRTKYEQMRRELLPRHEITLLEIYYSEFARGSGKRLLRNTADDIEILRRRLAAYITQPSDTEGI